MKFAENIKKKIRSIPMVARRLSQYRGRLQDESYLRLCEDAYKRLPQAFGPTEGMPIARQMLQQTWPGPLRIKKSMDEVHIFLIDRPAMRGPWIEEGLAPHCRLTVFSLTRHKMGYQSGQDDLVSFSQGIDPKDRLRPAFFPEDISGWRACVQKDLLESVRQAWASHPIDLCFAYGTPREFDRATFQEIRKLGVPVCLWYLDEKHGFLRNQEPLIGSYDLHLSNSFEAMRWYLSRGQSCYFFPEAADPSIYHPRNVQRDIPVSFLGAAYGRRLQFIEQLKRARIPIECFGPGWPNGVVEDIVDIFCRSRVNLGFGFTGRSENLTCIKDRDFQVPATRSLYLTTYDPDLTKVFHVGSEILCYRTQYDCVDQIRYYLEKREEAEAVAQAGYRRVLQQHTPAQRFKDLLVWMGILQEQAIVRSIAV